VLEIVGLGATCKAAAHWSDSERIKGLRDQLWERLENRFGTSVSLNGHPERRLPNTLNVSFRGRYGGEVLARIPDLAASTGAACHAGRAEMSSVLQAMGTDELDGLGAVRFSLGRETTLAELDRVVELVTDVL
jgi:cysteine desulfurase